MTKMECVYRGDGQTSMRHLENGAEIMTDLPLDNGGKERSFSPTDIFAASLASCALTIMGKMAESRGKSVEGTRVVVEKEMASEPRRVAKIKLQFIFPDSVADDDRAKWLKSLHACPIHNSIHPDLAVEVC